MMFPSKTPSLLLPKAPYFARINGIRVWWIDRMAERRGRADSTQVFDDEGHVPWTRAAHRRADRIIARIDDALRKELDTIDREIAQHQNALTDPEPSTDSSHPPQLEGDVTSLQLDAHRRALSKHEAQVRQHEQQQRTARARISELQDQRNNLRMAARDIADSWSTRCDEIVARHRRGYDKALGEVRPATTQVPRHLAHYEWAIRDQKVTDQKVTES